MSYFNSRIIYSRCIFIFIFIFQLVEGTPPKILNFTYRAKTFEILDLTLANNIITLEVDQDLYHKVQCPIEFSESSRAQFVPCCSSTNSTIGCFQPSSPQELCIDENHAVETGLQEADGSGYKRYAFQISNYASCHSISMLAKAISGQIILAVSVRPRDKVSASYNDFLRVEYGSNGLSLCCSTIRDFNPSWTGQVNVAWKPFITARYEFSVTTPVDIKCDGLHFSSEDCRERGGCFPTPATSDPLFSLMAGIGGLEPAIPNPKQFSTGIVIRKDQFSNAKTSSVSFPFPQARFSDSSCVFTFPTLANNQSELLANALGLPLENRIECDPVRYNETLTEFRNRVSDLGRADPRIFYETNKIFFQVAVWTASDAWTACTELITQRLLNTAISEVTLENTNICLESYSSETYFNDPCCNPNLQRTECCALRDVTGHINSFELNANNVAEMCQTPRCASNLLSDFVVLSDSTADRRTGCAVRTTQALGTGVNVADDVEACMTAIQPTMCTSDAPCKQWYAASVCMPSGWCSVPCQSDDQCATGVCELVPGTKNVTSCKLISFDNIANITSEMVMNATIQCLSINIDPFSLLFVKQNLGLNTTTTREEMIYAMLDFASIEMCFGVNTPSLADCDTVKTCNWAICNSISNPFCNVENCTDPNLHSDYFCGVCQEGFCAEVSQFGRCEYLTNSSVECFAVGGSYNGLSFENVINPKCIVPNVTSSVDCYVPEFCSSSSSCSVTRCYVPNLTMGNCTVTNAGLALTWTSWTIGNNSYGLCTTLQPVNSYSTCVTADPQLRWWPGTQWISPLLAMQSQCEQVGLCGENVGVQSMCNNQYTCSDGVSNSQQTCESIGTCNDFNGCVFDWDPVDFRCRIGFIWTPLGCLSINIDNSLDCTGQGGRWLTKATTRTECESKAVICQEPKLSVILYLFPTPDTEMPPEISFKNHSECTACGGTPYSFYSWTGGQWRPKLFRQFEWHQREFVRSNLLVRVPDTDAFIPPITAAIARRYAKALESDLHCRYGQFATSVSSLVCDCKHGGEDCFSGVASSVVGVGTACSNIPNNLTSAVATVIVGSNFVVEGNDCMNIRINVVPRSQFVAKEVASLSAASVSSVKSQQRRSVLFIRNNEGIVVGQIISDGIKIDRDPLTFTGSLQTCIGFPREFQADMPVYDYRWAVPNDEFTSFTLIDPATQPGEVSCYPLSNATQIYFPVGLQENWQSASFVATWFPGEIFFLVLGMVWYFTIFIFTGYHFMLHALLHAPNTIFFTLSTTALLISLIFLLNRFIYMILILSGVMDQNPQVDVVFSSFPALLFYVIYSIIVIRWAEIYHFTMTAGAKQGISKLRPAIIALNAVLFVAFALLIILYFSLQDFTTVIYSCSTPDSVLMNKSIGDIVSIVYKAFFAVVSAVLSALFVIYGARVLLLMRRATRNATKTREKNKAREAAFTKLMAVSGVCTIALLAQAVFLLWSSATSSSQDEGRFYGILTFLYLTEMPPAIIFVIMFKKASSFIKGDRNTMAATRSTIGSDSVGDSAPMQPVE